MSRPYQPRTFNGSVNFRGTKEDINLLELLAKNLRVPKTVVLRKGLNLLAQAVNEGKNVSASEWIFHPGIKDFQERMNHANEKLIAMVTKRKKS